LIRAETGQSWRTARSYASQLGDGALLEQFGRRVSSRITPEPPIISARASLRSGIHSDIQALESAARNECSSKYPAKTALSGPLDLSVSSISHLQNSQIHKNLARFLTSKKNYIKRRLEFNGYISPESDPQYKEHISSILDDAERIGDIWHSEAPATKNNLAKAVLSDLLKHPKQLCRVLPTILTQSQDEHEEYLQNAKSIHVMRYLYYTCLLDGLNTCSIAPEFYECLFQMVRNRGDRWATRLLSILPNYYLHERCPTHLRNIFKDVAVFNSPVDHFEGKFMRIHEMAAQGEVLGAVTSFLKLQRKSFLSETVEHYNTVSVLLEAAGKHCSKEDATWLLADMLSSRLVKDPDTFPLFIDFVVKNALPDGIRALSRRLMEMGRPSPALVVQVLRAMKSLNVAEDESDPLHQLLVENSSRERSYAVLSSLERMRILRKRSHESGIYAQMLSFIQNHGNVEILVRLGLADRVASTEQPYLDGPLASMLIHQYFIENNYSTRAVMPVYNRFKEMLNYDDEVIRMVAYPNPSIFNSFIVAFTHMPKENLSDALDVLAELTHNHDPIKNMPRLLRKGMGKSSRLHAGPNAETYRSLISAFVRHGQLQAAERCLAEIWKKWPDHYSLPCDTLIHACVEIGENNKAAYYLTRKINAGYPVTDRTLRALSPPIKHTKVKSVRRHSKQNTGAEIEPWARQWTPEEQ
jgi:pentatricopeptide repeat protein